MKLSTFASNRTSFPTCAEGTSPNQMALGGRSPSVLIIREHFYRLCELYTNLNLPPETALSLFRESLPLVMQALQNSTGGTSSLVVAHHLRTARHRARQKEDAGTVSRPITERGPFPFGGQFETPVSLSCHPIR